MYESFVAVGDSFTEGLMDQRSDGSVRGWADLVAVRLAELTDGLQYANLAVRGRKLAEICEEQIPVALSLSPALISFGAGGNDIVRLTSPVSALTASFDCALAQLCATGATVVTFAGFDPRRRMSLVGSQGERAEQYNDGIRRSSLRHNAVLVDLWDLPRIYEDWMWAPDRLHLSTCGHALVAGAVLDALGDSHHQYTVPEADGGRRTWLARRVEDVRWLTVDVLPWAYRGFRGRSSGDAMGPKYPGMITVGQETDLR